LIRSGIQHKFANYIPHVTVSYNWHANTPLPTLVPDFDLMFDWIEADAVDPNYAAKTN
jgi:2'-5' RNA ligase